jgi:hypothetical protein
MNRMLRNALLAIAFTAGLAATTIPASAEFFSDLGKKTADDCMASGTSGLSCCKDHMKCDELTTTKPNMTQALCMKGQQKCDTMLRCDRDLNRCKKDKMATDKNCSTADCKKCTSDYKDCHDRAVSQ